MTSFKLKYKNTVCELWWLSFVDDDGCKGVALVEAPSFMLAVTQCNFLGINPGGEVAGWPVPENMTKEYRPHMNRLLSLDECRKLFDAKSIREFNEEVKS